MKKVLLSLLVIVLTLGLVGAAAYAGYRYGFTQGTLATSDGNFRSLLPGFWARPDRMPMHSFGFDRGFARDEFRIMRPGIGFSFGFFRPLAFLAQLLFWGLILWGIYALVKHSGWRLTRTEPFASTPVVETSPSVSKDETKDN